MDSLTTSSESGKTNLSAARLMSELRDRAVSGQCKGGIISSSLGINNKRHVRSLLCYTIAHGFVFLRPRCPRKAIHLYLRWPMTRSHPVPWEAVVVLF